MTARDTFRRFRLVRALGACLAGVSEVELQPSRVLFDTEPETYRAYLAEFETGSDESRPDGAEDAPREVSA